LIETRENDKKKILFPYLGYRYHKA